MWIISKEGLIVLGVIAVLGVVGVVLLLTSPRTPAPASVTVAAPVAASPQVPTVSVPTASVVPAPPTVPTPIPALPAPGPVAAIDGIIYGGEYAHNTQAAGFAIHWTNDAKTLRVGLISPGTGYLAIGFDPVFRMQGANYILGAVTAGRVNARDDFGSGPVSHSPDTANGGGDNILEAAGLEAEGKTYFEFSIPLDSGDAMDRVLVPGNTYKVVIAYHETSDDFSERHDRRGSGTITLDLAP